jgi:hypothetical protein
LVNVLIEHHPTTGNIISNKQILFQVIFKVPLKQDIYRPLLYLHLEAKSPAYNAKVDETHPSVLGIAWPLKFGGIT